MSKPDHIYNPALATKIAFIILLTIVTSMGCDKREEKKETETYSYDGKKGGKDLQLLSATKDNGLYYLDLNSLNREGDIVEYSLITNFTGEQLKRLKERGLGTSAKYFEKVDCAQQKIASLRFESYENYWASGQKVGIGDLDNKWESLNPDSQGKFKLDLVCNLGKISKISASQTVVETQSSAVDLTSPTQSMQTSTSSASAPASAPASASASAPAPAPAPVPTADNSPFTPSFDCAKASNGQEKMVCSDRELSKLDVELSQKYSKARETSTDKEKLKKEQLEWIKFSLRACSDKPCLIDTYRKRISELQ